MATQEVSVDPHLQKAREISEIFDPFKQDLIGRRLMARGIYNFCMEMAVSSDEVIEANARRLISLPNEKQEKLMNCLIAASTRLAIDVYFKPHGVEVTDRERVSMGAVYALSATRRIEKEMKRDLGSDEVTVITPDSIRLATMKLEDCRDSGERYKLASSLIGSVQSYITDNHLKLRRGLGWQEFEPTLENLVKGIFKIERNGEIVEKGFINQAVEDVHAAFLLHELEEKIKLLPLKDKKRFEKLRREFGAKGANLMLLVEALDTLKSLNIDTDFLGPLPEVPEFSLAPTSLYLKWKNGELTDDDLHPYFEFTKNLLKPNGEKDSCIVRSSAVYSEDGEELTGAGKYRSVVVDGNWDFAAFKKAVEEVYESVESTEAIDYRKSNGIEIEEMGLVVQRYIPGERGYVNSQLAGNSKLIEIKTARSRNFVNRHNMSFLLGMNIQHANAQFGYFDIFDKVHHFPPDEMLVNEDGLVNVAKYALIIEKLWGRPVNIEFVEDLGVRSFVQVREIPKRALLGTEAVEFPNEDPIHTDAAINSGDLELEVLNDQDDISQKRGVIIIESNMLLSESDVSPILPREGAVIIADGEGPNGHIQTLCAELGLICLFPPTGYYNSHKALDYQNLLKLVGKKLRVVANGMEGRVYEVDEKPETT
jgi:hypothetical protein